MKRFTSRLLVSLMLLTSLTTNTAVPVAAATSTGCTGNTSAGQVLQGIGQTTTDCSGSGFTNLIGTVVSILSYIVGAAAVIMIIVAGLKYITSGGDSNNIASAKTTLIYALVGIVIAVLAQFLVKYVFVKATGA